MPMIRALIRIRFCMRSLRVVMLAAVCASFLMTSACSNGQEAEPKAAGEEKHEAEAAEHDPTNLTEANGTDNLTAAQEVRFDQVLASIVVFLLLMAILGKLAWKPITQGLDSREQSIKNMIDEAQRNHEAAASRLREYEARLTAAAEESRTIIVQAQKDAEKAAERIKVDAEAAAERERSRALADIQSAKTAALDEVAQKSVDMAVALAGRIIQKQLNASDHAKLISEAIEQLPSRN